MDPITAAIGLGIAGMGAWEKSKAGDKADKAYKEMARLSAQMAAVSAQQEKLRRIQMQEEYIRTSRNVIRQQNFARAQSLSRMTSQGVSVAESGRGSAYGGAQAQIAMDSAGQQTALFSNYQRGEKMFDLNAQMANLQGQYNQFGTAVNMANRDAQYGDALFSTGSSIVQNSTKLSNIADAVFNI